MAVVFLAIVITTTPNLPGWCQPDEAGVVCLRNWVNAAGNIFAVIVAGVAAYFALGSMKAAVQQTRLGVIPLLTSRYELAKSLLTMTIKIEKPLRDASNLCRNLNKNINNANYPASIIPTHIGLLLKLMSQMDELLLEVHALKFSDYMLSELNDPYETIRSCANECYIQKITLTTCLPMIQHVLKSNPGKLMGEVSPEIDPQLLHLVRVNGVKFEESHDRLMQANKAITQVMITISNRSNDLQSFD